MIPIFPTVKKCKFAVIKFQNHSAGTREKGSSYHFYKKSNQGKSENQACSGSRG
jgi:hypothetical protein